MAAQQFVERQGLVGRATQEEAQAVDAELLKRHLGRQAFQRDAEHATGAGGGGVGGRDDRQAGQPDVLHLDRPERDGAGGAIAQSFAVHRFGIERDPRGQAGGKQQLGLAVELHHHAGRHGREVVRVEQAEQGVGELGEFVVEAVLHAAGEEGDAFQQAGDVRVVHRIGREAQAAGDLRVGIGEFRGQAFDGCQFAVVVGEEGVGHGFLQNLSRLRGRACP